jgi:glutathione S-transferase
MKIFDDPKAPNPRRVRIFLAEKGIKMDFEHVEFMKAEHKTAKFLKKNPMAQLPVLEMDDGHYLSETVSICRYFESLFPDPPLMGQPGDAADIAFTDMWQRRMEFNIFAPIAACFRHLHPAMVAFQTPQIEEWGKTSARQAAQALDWLDTELDARSFIAGERFTIADITALVAVDFAKPARIDALAERANLSRWHEAVSARPGVLKEAAS